MLLQLSMDLVDVEAHEYTSGPWGGDRVSASRNVHLPVQLPEFDIFHAKQFRTDKNGGNMGGRWTIGRTEGMTGVKWGGGQGGGSRLSTLGNCPGGPTHSPLLPGGKIQTDTQDQPDSGLLYS